VSRRLVATPLLLLVLGAGALAIAGESAAQASGFGFGRSVLDTIAWGSFGGTVVLAAVLLGRDRSRAWLGRFAARVAGERRDPKDVRRYRLSARALAFAVPLWAWVAGVSAFDRGAGPGAILGAAVAGLGPALLVVVVAARISFTPATASPSAAPPSPPST
jgi:hypothetical protein